MPSKISQLRALDAEMVQHVLERGKLWERRKKLVQELAGSEDLDTYQAELAEWLTEATTILEELQATRSNVQEHK